MLPIRYMNGRSLSPSKKMGRRVDLARCDGRTSAQSRLPGLPPSESASHILQYRHCELKGDRTDSGTSGGCAKTSLLVIHKQIRLSSQLIRREEMGTPSDYIQGHMSTCRGDKNIMDHTHTAFAVTRPSRRWKWEVQRDAIWVQLAGRPMRARMQEHSDGRCRLN